MARQYSARTFLRNTPNDLLKRYFEKRGVRFRVSWIVAHETDVNWILGELERLPDALRSSIDSDFRLINDMACETGVLALLDKAGVPDDDWSARLAGMRNNYERAFWAFLTDPQRFRLAGCFHEMDRYGGWRRRFVGVHLEAASDDESLRAFEQALRQCYRRQGRGRFCHVDYYLRQGPERHCYFAYPEDYATTELGYDDDGRFQSRSRRAAFELIFVYRPEEGVLEIHGRGGKKQMAELQEIFCTHILGLERMPDDEGRVPYDLSVLKDRNFPFKTDPEDRIAAVEVRLLRLDLPSEPGQRGRRRIVLEVTSRDHTGDALYRLLDEALNTNGLPLHALHVSEAKMRFTFEPVNGERPKTLTFDLRYPDRCTLKDDPHDQIARKYLRRWGIAHD